jgi:hypothetical protein
MVRNGQIVAIVEDKGNWTLSGSDIVNEYNSLMLLKSTSTSGYLSKCFRHQSTLPILAVESQKIWIPGLFIKVKSALFVMMPKVMTLCMSLKEFRILPKTLLFCNVFLTLTAWLITITWIPFQLQRVVPELILPLNQRVPQHLKAAVSEKEAIYGMILMWMTSS